MYDFVLDPGHDKTRFYKDSQPRVSMALVGSPPRPTVSRKERRGNKYYWTIHTHENHAFTARVHENSQTAIVGFKNSGDATTVGKMLETHYLIKKEWPHTMDNLHLPEPKEGMELYHLFFRKWETTDLEVTCTKNFLSMIVIDDIGPSKKGLNFNGKLYSFDAPHDFYINRLAELYSME